MSSVLGISLPADWLAVPFKHLTQLLSRGTAPDYVEDGAIRVISQAANQESGIDWPRTRYHGFSGDPRKIKGYLHAGDVLVNSTGTGTLGRVGYFTGAPEGGHAIADGHLTVARTDVAKLDSRYCYYWLGGRPFQGYVLAALAVGATNQIELNRDRLGSALVPLPPLEEQRRIADFLDAEIAKLERMVAAQRRIFEVLNERVDSQVLQIIGASALGGLPDGIELAPMRRLLLKLARPAVTTPEIITAFRDGQVTARSVRRAEGYTNSASSEPGGQFVKLDDVVVHGLDGFAGAIGSSEAEGNCSPVYHVLIPRDGGDALYYGRLLRILAVQGYLTGFSFSTRERAFDFRNWDMFGRIPIPVAKIEDQRIIGAQIRRVRPLREKVDRFRELAIERRQALVTAAVTGQFDVSTASGRGVDVS